MDVIKWQSKLFPKLILTESHYQEMRKLFVNIKSFRDQMEKLEKWLWANESKRPKSHWKTQVSNWMRIADDIEKKERERRLVKGKEKQQFTKREASMALSTILSGIIEEKPVTNQFECTKCKKVHHPKFNCQA